MRISDWSSDVCSSDLGWRNDCRVSCPMEPCSAFVLRRATPACLWQTRRITQQPGRIGQSPLVQSHHLRRSEEHTSELQSLMRISYAVFCLKKKTTLHHVHLHHHSLTSVLCQTNIILSLQQP